jgi:hypothetical protein
MNDTDYIERKRGEAVRHYDASISRLSEGMACTPCVSGPRITLRDGRYYVDPLRRVWANDEVPEGLVPVAQETALTLAVAYDLDAYGVVGAVEPSESNRTLALALVAAANAVAADSGDENDDVRLYEAEGAIIERLGIDGNDTEQGLTREAVERIEAFVTEALGRSWSYEDAGLLGTSGVA